MGDAGGGGRGFASKREGIPTADRPLSIEIAKVFNHQNEKQTRTHPLGQIHDLTPLERVLRDDGTPSGDKDSDRNVK